MFDAEVMYNEFISFLAKKLKKSSMLLLQNKVDQSKVRGQKTNQKLAKNSLKVPWEELQSQVIIRCGFSKRFSYLFHENMSPLIHHNWPQVDHSVYKKETSN